MIAVELSFQQLIQAVKQLSPSEKLALNEVIWTEDMAIPVEHQKIVNERITKAIDNPDMLLDWDVAVKSLNV